MKSVKLPKTESSNATDFLKDKKQVIAFLDDQSKALGAANHLGTFAEEIKVQTDVALKAKTKILSINRRIETCENPGAEYKLEKSASSDLYSYPYELPEKFPKSETEGTPFVLLNTVETHKCDPKEECPVCNGTGKCVVCEGRGWNSCEKCEGTGKIKKYDGKTANGKPKYKSVACPSCHGSKKKNCINCSTTKKCPNCGGTRKVVCQRCEGTGKVQTFDTCLTYYDTQENLIVQSEYPELEDIIANAAGTPVFDGCLFEKDKNETVVDESNSFRDKPHAEQLLKEITSAVGEDGRKVGRVLCCIESAFITQVSYQFEDQEYSLFVLGEDNSVHFESIPKKSIHNKRGLLGKLKKLFFNKKQKISLLHLASYIFGADDDFSETEMSFFDKMLDNIKVKGDKKQELIESLQVHRNFDDLIPLIKAIKGDRGALVFAWQCVIRDQKVCDAEEEAFSKIAGYFKINEEEIVTIKRKAEQMKALSDDDVLEECFC